MATVINTLYPPQIGGSGTFMPAFVIDEDGKGTAKVRFSISPYNTADSIKGVHVTCVRMDSNLNALDAPTGVYCISLDALEKDGDEYLLPIGSNGEHSDVTQPDLVGQALMYDKFVPNTYYKVQIRFDCNASLPLADGTKGGNLDSDYLAKNTDVFSEWSSVCLIRAIGTPKLVVTGFSKDPGTLYDEDDIPVFTRGIIPISGTVSFDPSGEQIESCKVTVKPLQTEDVLVQTGIIYCFNNKISYKLDTEGFSTTQGSKFEATLEITTENQYKFSESFQFELGEFSRNDLFKPTIEVESLPDNGAVRVTVENYTAVSGVLLIRRASSLDSFSDWETVHATFINGPINLSYDDMTVCSGVIYRYSATLETAEGTYSEEEDTFNVTKRFFTKAYKSEKVIPDFYDAMFYRLERQIAIRYNFSISSYKPVVNRTKVDTLGGKYPRFVENADLGYKQFSLSGMISSQEDPDYKFLSREQYYQDNLRDITRYNSDNEVRPAYDFFWEREFREELLKWLNDGEPKLMRTMTEGNLCVMLTDISLTPNATLGRRLYTFTATAYEVEDGTDLATVMSLGIHSNGADEAELQLGKSYSAGKSVSKIEKVGQLYERVPAKKIGDTYETSSDVVDSVIENIKWKFSKGGLYLGHTVENAYVRDVKVTFLSDPHLYTYTNDDIEDWSGAAYNSRSNRPVSKDPNKTTTAFVTGMTTHQPDKNHDHKHGTALMSGYRMQLNGKDIFVNIGRYYQVPSEVKVNSLSFPSVAEKDEENRDIVTIDYVLGYDDVLDRSLLPSTTENMTSYKSVFGQISGVYQPGERLGDRVYDRYAFTEKVDGKEISYAMDYWKGISLETQPYAVFQIMFEDDTEYQKIVVGPSGIYNIDDGFPCEDLYFEGIKIFRHGCNRDSKDDVPDTQSVSCERETLTAGEFYFGGTLKYRKEAQPGRVYIINDEGDMQFYSLDKRWFDFEPEPKMVPYQNTGSNVVNYKPNRNPKAGIINSPVNAFLNYSGTIMKTYGA